MHSESSHDEQKERLRLCPTCRMAISVLATKCRFCGEPVGRPRDENRKLTVTDLGGANVSTYAPSGEVLDAIEAFRQEELTALGHKEEEPPPAWWQFWRGKEEEAAEKPAEPAPVVPLESRKIEISGFATTSSKQHQSTAHRRAPSGLGHRLAWAAGIAIGVLVLYLAGGVLKSWIDGYLASRNAKPAVTTENPAVAIINKNGPAIEALRAALGALAENNSVDNRLVLDRARELVCKEARAKLDAIPWSRPMLDEASSLASQALDADPASPVLKELKEEINRELVLYKMSIANLDVAGRKVILRITYPGQQPENIQYSEGEKVKDRLDIKRISQDGVTFEDPLRKSAGGLQRRFRLSIDGNVSVM